jgi:hypothetical protein
MPHGIRTPPHAQMHSPFESATDPTQGTDPITAVYKPKHPMWATAPFATGLNPQGAANQARGWPVIISLPTIVDTFHIFVGTQSGNICVAIYDQSGVRLVTTGSIACPAGNANVSFPETTLAAGLYYFALGADNTTATFASWTNPGTTGRVSGGFTDSGFPCNPTVTPDNNSAGYGFVIAVAHS